MTHACTHARTHTHGANYNLPPASREGDKKVLKYVKNMKQASTIAAITHPIFESEKNR